MATTTTVAPVTTISAYFVGNSLTNQTLGRPASRNGPAFFLLAQQADHLVQPLGWHVKCASSLISIATHPDETCIEPDDDLGYFYEALPARTWDFLVVQPHPDRNSTLATDVNVIHDLAKLVSPDTTILVLTGWPRLSEFTEQWDADDEIAADSRTVHSRIYFETLMRRLGDLLDQEVKLIPAAEVLYRIQPRLASGAVPGLTGLADLYSDDVHLNDLGDWLSGVTTASVMTGADPLVFYKPSTPSYGDSSEFPDEFIGLVRVVIAEVLAE